LNLKLGNNVTDAGLVHLKRVTQLHMLDFTRTKASKAGIKDLLKALNWNVPAP
jgi:hypothetical protein